MATYFGVSVDSLEEWLWSLGCTKRACPTDFICVWLPPGGLPPFTAPNPTHFHYVPIGEMSRLADLIADIMKNGGLGAP